MNYTSVYICGMSVVIDKSMIKKVVDGKIIIPLPNV